MELPKGFRSEFADCGAVRLHVVTNRMGGDSVADTRRPVVFLHGFPEYWIAWAPVFQLLADEFLVIASDQRGFNLSDAPQAVGEYRAGLLVGDLLAVADKLLGQRRFLLAGHDWGASVAYAVAMARPDRICGLFVANGVHPVPFQRAILDDPEQRLASQYIRYLRQADAAQKLAEDGFRRTFGMFEKFSRAPWLDAQLRAAYARAWSRPGRLNAMLNWYRASPLVVPLPGEEAPASPLLQLPPGELAVHVPHALAWGARDIALRASARAGLERFCADLTSIELPEADHWVLHTHAERLAAEIRRFAQRLDWEGAAAQ